MFAIFNFTGYNLNTNCHLLASNGISSMPSLLYIRNAWRNPLALQRPGYIVNPNIGDCLSIRIFTSTVPSSLSLTNFASFLESIEIILLPILMDAL
ncbi:hypothetical protein Henu6_gp108 [Acinetobacter phage Henu6]|uniref:Uncharacterized protein n=1 Tax=Acinetobacter phage Henu6 TaxID=2500136 RepID=A0A410T5L6_9CAUD|nr:hypothetical protein Henu6_gp108 [Acinetobacter phage Henu6]